MTPRGRGCARPCRQPVDRDAIPPQAPLTFGGARVCLHGTSFAVLACRTNHDAVTRASASPLRRGLDADQTTACPGSPGSPFIPAARSTLGVAGHQARAALLGARCPAGWGVDWGALEEGPKPDQPLGDSVAPGGDLSADPHLRERPDQNTGAPLATEPAARATARPPSAGPAGAPHCAAQTTALGYPGQPSPRRTEHTAALVSGSRMAGQTQPHGPASLRRTRRAPQPGARPRR